MGSLFDDLYNKDEVEKRAGKWKLRRGWRGTARATGVGGGRPHSLWGTRKRSLGTPTPRDYRRSLPRPRPAQAESALFDNKGPARGQGPFPSHTMVPSSTPGGTRIPPLHRTRPQVGRPALAIARRTETGHKVTSVVCAADVQREREREMKKGRTVAGRTIHSP
ncbi:hypothetical protein MTO96_026076 [Rhipicephalus appendiculatus]